MKSVSSRFSEVIYHGVEIGEIGAIITRIDLYPFCLSAYIDKPVWMYLIYLVPATEDRDPFYINMFNFNSSMDK